MQIAMEPTSSTPFSIKIHVARPLVLMRAIGARIFRPSRATRSSRLTFPRQQEICMTSGETRELHRGIGTRQLSMIAIGGAIGTGLFFASGGAIAQAGPGGAMLAYATMGLAVYCMMQSLGEMATQLPIPGSFEAYAERFIDPSLGFA